MMMMVIIITTIRSRSMPKNREMKKNALTSEEIKKLKKDASFSVL